MKTGILALIIMISGTAYAEMPFTERLISDFPALYTGRMSPPDTNLPGNFKPEVTNPFRSNYDVTGRLRLENVEALWNFFGNAIVKTEGCEVSIAPEWVIHRDGLKLATAVPYLNIKINTQTENGKHINRDYLLYFINYSEWNLKSRGKVDHSSENERIVLDFEITPKRLWKDLMPEKLAKFDAEKGEIVFYHDNKGTIYKLEMYISGKLYHQEHTDAILCGW